MRRQRTRPDSASFEKVNFLSVSMPLPSRSFAALPILSNIMAICVAGRDAGPVKARCGWALGAEQGR